MTAVGKVLPLFRFAMSIGDRGFAIALDRSGPGGNVLRRHRAEFGRSRISIVFGTHIVQILLTRQQRALAQPLRLGRRCSIARRRFVALHIQALKQFVEQPAGRRRTPGNFCSIVWRLAGRSGRRRATHRRRCTRRRRHVVTRRIAASIASGEQRGRECEG